MVSPDSRDTACPLSGRNSTYRPVQISGTGSSFPIASKEGPSPLESGRCAVVEAANFAVHDAKPSREFV
jgi:hypothetical protein